MNSFHYAFKVKDIPSTIAFYRDVLGCEIGRQSETWVDINFFEHQLSAHISDNIPDLDYCGLVDGVKVPIPHFGCVVDEEQFDQLKANLEEHGIDFVIKPQTRYEGEPVEQKTMFVLDFSNNPLEFKYYKHKEHMF